jgi:hypothetical protein
MYKYIVNPKTGRKVKINGKIGRQVFKQYLNQTGGEVTIREFEDNKILLTGSDIEAVILEFVNQYNRFYSSRERYGWFEFNLGYINRLYQIQIQPVSMGGIASIEIPGKAPIINLDNVTKKFRFIFGLNKDDDRADQWQKSLPFILRKILLFLHENPRYTMAGKIYLFPDGEENMQCGKFFNFMISEINKFMYDTFLGVAGIDIPGDTAVCKQILRDLKDNGFSPASCLLATISNIVLMPRLDFQKDYNKNVKGRKFEYIYSSDNSLLLTYRDEVIWGIVSTALMFPQAEGTGRNMTEYYDIDYLRTLKDLPGVQQEWYIHNKASSLQMSRSMATGFAATTPILNLISE